MNVVISFRSMGVFLYLSSIAGTFGQVTSPSQPLQPVSPSTGQQVSQNQATLQAFLTEQEALGTELQSLMTQGATPKQIKAWRQQNAVQFATQEQWIEARAMTGGKYRLLR